MVIGGDGTVRDAAEGLCSSTRGHPLPVGILPGGTGNDLARTLSLPRDLTAALDVALTGETRLLDVWTWNGTPFVNVTGVGLDAAAAETVNRRVRKLHGTLAYIVALCMTLPGFKPLRLSLRFPDGEWSGEAWLAAFANAQFYGGGMQMAPQALPDDGLLDVVVIENVPKIELLRQFPGLFKGAHIRHPRVRSFRVAEVEVEAAAYPASVDGELIGATPARVVRATRQLAVRVPRRGT
jgi:YegS/Rv2252/BmrU family lipid kinase